MKIDAEQEPPFFELSKTHKAATWLLAPQAPKVTPHRRNPTSLGLSLKRNKKHTYGQGGIADAK